MEQSSDKCLMEILIASRSLENSKISKQARLQSPLY
jgi:hypothetical protein